MNDNLQERMLEQARLALQADSANVEQRYNNLLDELERVFGKNHKDVAAELQRIAKSIEDNGDIDSAFAFKQRTCEIMLKRNMEQRRQNNTAPHRPAPIVIERPPTVPHVLRFLGPMEYICIPAIDARAEVEFYKRVLHAEQLFEHSVAVTIIGIKFAQGPALLFIEDLALGGCQPVFATDNLVRVLSELKKHEVEPVCGPIITGIGNIVGFQDSVGHRFAVIEKKRGRY